jgi:hypothetical protein
MKERDLQHDVGHWSRIGDRVISLVEAVKGNYGRRS